MTSSNGNIFRVTGHLCGEFIGHRWIPITKASDAELWYFLWSAPWINGWVNNREPGDLRHPHAHYDVIVMARYVISIIPYTESWDAYLLKRTTFNFTNRDRNVQYAKPLCVWRHNRPKQTYTLSGQCVREMYTDFAWGQIECRCQLPCRQVFWRNNHVIIASCVRWEDNINNLQRMLYFFSKSAGHVLIAYYDSIITTMPCTLCFLLLPMYTLVILLTIWFYKMFCQK